VVDLCMCTYTSWGFFFIPLFGMLVRKRWSRDLPAAMYPLPVQCQSHFIPALNPNTVLKDKFEVILHPFGVARRLRLQHIK